MAKVYECSNPACVLGTVGNPGHFTGGITASQLHILTGKPQADLKKDEDYGAGFCPNCGQKGKEE